MKRINTLAIPGLALASLLLLAFPAYASATTFTMTVKDLTVGPFLVTPIVCPDGTTIPGGILTLTVNGVFHVTNDTAGGIHFTSTTTGNLTLVGLNPDGTLTGVTYTGHFTTWDGGTVHITSTGATEFGFTFSAHATGTDGSTFAFHQGLHITFNPGGTITANMTRLTC
jgi:hypothetical protein